LKKAPRFFCDNCGCEVDTRAKVCPHCGRFFASVRCPACGFSGEEKLFLRGCPSCGYSTPSFKQKPRFPAKKNSSSALAPGWLYFLSIAVLLIIIAILAFIITR
jgi:predicted RNA-binding Zn-ribbon protein involved in translation (DUF1610 family)